MASNEYLDYVNRNAPLGFKDLAAYHLNEDDFELIKNIDFVKLNSKIARFTNLQKLVLYFYYWHGINSPKIASLLGIGKSGVLLHKRKAEKKLQNFLKNREIRPNCLKCGSNHIIHSGPNWRCQTCGTKIRKSKLMKLALTGGTP